MNRNIIVDENQKKWLVFFLKIAVSVILMLWVFFRVDWSAILRVFGETDATGVALYTILLVLGIAVSSYKWMLIGRKKGFPSPYTEYFRLYLTGMFVNNFFPSFIGGDAYRAYGLGAKEESRQPAFATVVFDRISGLWASVILATLFGSLYLTTAPRDETWFLMATVIAGMFFFAILLLIAPVRKRIRTLVGFLPHRASRPVGRFFDELELFGEASFLTRILSLGCIFAFIGVGLANLALFRAFGSTVDAVVFFGIVFFVSIVSSVPISINNIGLKEWAYVTFFAFAGISPEIALATALSGRFIQMFVSFAAIPFYLKGKKPNPDRA